MKPVAHLVRNKGPVFENPGIVQLNSFTANQCFLCTIQILIFMWKGKGLLFLKGKDETIEDAAQREQWCKLDYEASEVECKLIKGTWYFENRIGDAALKGTWYFALDECA